jgi:hypothetical protein
VLQEAPGRLTAIMQRLQNIRVFEKHELEISSDFQEASFELLAQAHTKEYAMAVLAVSVTLQICLLPKKKLS